jgi:hypothetical protein
VSLETGGAGGLLDFREGRLVAFAVGAVADDRTKTRHLQLGHIGRGDLRADREPAVDLPDIHDCFHPIRGYGLSCVIPSTGPVKVR